MVEPLFCRRVFHCTDTLQFVYPWTLGGSQLAAGRNKSAVNTQAQASV